MCYSKKTNHKKSSKGENEEQKSVHSYKKYQNCKAYTSLLVVTLNVDRLNFPIKCCRMGDETVSNNMMFKRDPFWIYGYAKMGLSWWLSSRESTYNARDTS